MALGADHGVMLPIPHLAIHSTMRRSVTGALATDPVMIDERRPARRPRRARPAPDRPRAVRTTATECQS
jgi:hypothetical protein